MIKELQETIKKHLPEAVAGQMKEFIEQAGKDVAELEVLREGTAKQMKELVEFRQAVGKLQDKNAQLKDQIKICEDCKTRYTELLYKEKELTTEQKCAGLRIDDMKELVSLVFRSPVYMKTTTETKSIPVKGCDNNGQGGDFVETHTDTKTETTSEL